jgi:hypothetical protein
MPPIHLMVASAEEAADGNAEFWCGPELIAVTVFHEGTRGGSHRRGCTCASTLAPTASRG